MEGKLQMTMKSIGVGSKEEMRFLKEIQELKKCRPKVAQVKAMEASVVGFNPLQGTRRGTSPPSCPRSTPSGTAGARSRGLCRSSWRAARPSRQHGPEDRREGGDPQEDPGGDAGAQPPEGRLPVKETEYRTYREGRQVRVCGPHVGDEGGLGSRARTRPPQVKPLARARAGLGAAGPSVRGRPWGDARLATPRAPKVAPVPQSSGGAWACFPRG
jgi:hypothetical protein